MKKIISFIFFSFLAFIIIAILVLGYLGLIPGLSAVFGSNKPRDLGVRYDQATLGVAQKKIGQNIVSATGDPYQQFKNSPGRPVDIVLTTEEYSAHAQAIHPVSDLQIKLQGNSFEISGRVDKKRIPQFVRTWGLTGASDNDILDVVEKYLPAEPVFYLSGTGGAKNNRLIVDLTKAELGRIPVPTEQAEEIARIYTETLFKQIPGFSVSEATIENGQLHFKGTAVSEVPKY